MTNTYSYQIRAVCPVHDGLIDCYQVTVRSESMIEVEKIIAFFDKYKTQKIFQEELTRLAATSLGASVELVGNHSGVTVRSIFP